MYVPTKPKSKETKDKSVFTKSMTWRLPVEYFYFGEE